MESVDFLYELAIRSDNLVLQLLSHTPSWKYIAEFARLTVFWFDRLEYLVGMTLIYDEQVDWKSVYYDFQLLDVKSDVARAYNIYTVAFLANWASVWVAIQLGYVPNNNKLTIACGEGYTETVALFLQEPHIDPASDDSRALRAACNRERIDTVRLLLEDGRADPTIYNSYCLEVVSLRDNVELVRLLLEDGRADPTIDRGSFIQQVREDEYFEILELLLADRRVIAAGLAK
ncbi:Hypothetical protein POVR2_LOCUS133 [uncultured virus]|nr:Hypothetical protein POVR2_LOCUS133 [uncultured virus]